MPPKAKKFKETPNSVRQENVLKKLDSLFAKEHIKDIPKNCTKSIVHFSSNLHQGFIKAVEVQRFSELVVSRKLSKFELFKTDPNNFDRRITALRFHPTAPNVIGIGSKSGEFVVRFLCSKDTKPSFVSWPGIGPGGSITDISFDPFTPNSVFTSSIDGTVTIRNYADKSCKELLSTGSFSDWYCSVNAAQSVGLVFAGDTKGRVKVLNKDLKEIASYKLHKKKVHSIDFCKSRGWLFATGSLDSTVKLWDARKIDTNIPLETMEHENPVNSAYFSQTNGNRLLTTDQHSELRVYKGPLFHLESRIPHPHRQFQYLTPIKAVWHPLCDLIVVGRYPDPKWPSYPPHGEMNSIDIISSETCEMLTQLSSCHADGVVSLNSFSCTGDILASGMGYFVLYRKERHSFEGKGINKPDNKGGGGDSDNDDDDNHPGPPKRQRPAKASKSKSNPSKVKSTRKKV